MYEGDRARKSAASKPAGFSAMSFPRKYITKTASMPAIAGRNEQNVIKKSMFTPLTKRNMLKSAAAVIGNAGNELDMSRP